MIIGDSLKISIAHGCFYIDPCDVSKIIGFNWRIFKIGNTSYVKSFKYSGGKPKETYYLHRLIMGVSKDTDMVVDHIDGNGLNNRKSNLRLLKRGQNATRQVNRERNGIMGVEKSGNLFFVRIKHDGKRYYIGKFNDEVMAGMAYDKAAIYFRGDLAILNFPDLVDQHSELVLRDFLK